jgi:DNA-binding CsgD family transcriptional regulator
VLSPALKVGNMKISGLGGPAHVGSHVNVLAAPKMAADSIARSLTLAGWKIGRVASTISELHGFEGGLKSGDVVVAVEGALPAGAVADEIRRRVPGVKTIVVSAEKSEPSADAIRILPTSEFRDLLKALEQFDSSPVLETSLTNRHLEILQLIAVGFSTDEVGEKLGIASKTVNNHLSAVYRRLRARNLTQAVLRAVRAGLIDIVPL